ncbi:unnamed protein product [Withania somnifera]
MASACINNVPENFVDRSPAKYSLDPEVSVNETVDFEFRLEHPVNMLPADELFSDGKLMPLQLPKSRAAITSTSDGVRSRETHKLRTDLSTKAPRCSSRWKELLGLKKLAPNYNEDKHEGQKTWKNFLNRSSTEDDSSLNLPLLNKDTSDCYNECLSISSSRLSLSSSSSSSYEHDDLPRLSLDSDKPNILFHNNQNSSNPNPPRIRLVKHRALSSENPIHRQPSDSTTLRGLSMDDSPRMNSSGKIVFHNLGRSASSPSSFNGGGSRYKHGGSVERSYSANVRVTPVLNVPVCSSLRRSSKSGVFWFPQFSSSQQKKDGNQKHNSSSRTRTDPIKE